MRAETWDASIQTLPEWQCRPHSADYIWRGPSQLRISKEVDPVSREIVAFHAEWLRSVDRVVYLDGRGHPPADAVEVVEFKRKHTANVHEALGEIRASLGALLVATLLTGGVLGAAVYAGIGDAIAQPATVHVTLPRESTAVRDLRIAAGRGQLHPTAWLRCSRLNRRPPPPQALRDRAGVRIQPMQRARQS